MKIQNTFKLAKAQIRQTPADSVPDAAGCLKMDNCSDSEALIRKLANSNRRLKIRLTNDFAFKKTFHNKIALSGLLSAALDIPTEQIEELEFPDTVLSGDHPGGKEGILDVRVRMNNQKKINVEMQVKKFSAWEERSLFYNCKMYTEHFPRGTSYSKLEECIHISILGFDLAKTEELYSVYELRNRKTGHLYSDKFSLRVLYLNHITQASEEEKQTELYRWARLISASDWEELQQIAGQNSSMKEAYQEMEKINSDSAQRYLYLKKEMEEADRASLIETGYADGLEKGSQRMSRLVQLLLDSGRTDDLRRASEESDYREMLMNELNL